MMKKFLISFILIALFLTAGCGSSPKFNVPVKYYYPKNQATYNAPDGLISYQLSEGESGDIQLILESYLAGPEDLTFYNPFPNGVKLISLKEKDLMVTVMLSDELASLTGIDATLACVCLARTTMELTGSDTVAITCESALINGEQMLYFTKDQILWLDESIGTPSSVATTHTK